MSAVNLQPTRALLVQPEDTIDIPYPALIASGTNTSVLANNLIDSAATFISKGVNVGDIIYSRSLVHAGYVSNVVSQTQLTLLAPSPLLFSSIGNDYLIYDGRNNTGCTIYVGATTTTVRVLTVNGDDLTFTIGGGNFLPVKVRRVFNTGTTNTSKIIALW